MRKKIHKKIQLQATGAGTIYGYVEVEYSGPVGFMYQSSGANVTGVLPIGSCDGVALGCVLTMAEGSLNAYQVGTVQQAPPFVGFAMESDGADASLEGYVIY